MESLGDQCETPAGHSTPLRSNQIVQNQDCKFKFSRRSATICGTANDCILSQTPPTARRRLGNPYETAERHATPRNHQKFIEPPCIWKERARAQQARNVSLSPTQGEIMSQNTKPSSQNTKHSSQNNKPVGIGSKFSAWPFATNVAVPTLWSVLSFDGEGEASSLPNSRLPNRRQPSEDCRPISRKRRRHDRYIDDSPTTPERQRRLRSRASPPFNSLARLRTLRRVSRACNKQLFAIFQNTGTTTTTHHNNLTANSADLPPVRDRLDI